MFPMNIKATTKGIKIVIVVAAVVSLLFLYTSCAVHAVKEPLEKAPDHGIEQKAETPPQTESPIDGIFHIVKKGENLYRISKTYGIDLSKIVEINNIEDPSKIYIGQPVFIPGATKQLKIPTIQRKTSHNSTVTLFIWPVSGEISSRFGEKRSNHYHSGIDIRSLYGIPIHASKAGIVIFSGYQRGYGRTVIIDHQDGFSTLYAHNCKNLVKVGDRVSQGEVIAKVGTTGNASGSHVHFEIRVNGIAIDPLPYLD